MDSLVNFLSREDVDEYLEEETEILAQADTVSRLLGFVTSVKDDSGSEEEKDRRLRLASNAGKVLASPIRRPLYELGSQEGHLRKVFELVEAPVTSYSAALFSTIFSSLLHQHKQLDLVSPFLASNAELLSSLAAHLCQPAVLEVLQVVLDAAGESDAILSAIIASGCLLLAADSIHPQHTDDSYEEEMRQSNAADLLRHALKVAEKGTRQNVLKVVEKGTSDNPGIIPRLLRHLFSLSMVERLVHPLSVADVPFGREHQFSLRVLEAHIGTGSLVFFLSLCSVECADGDAADGDADRKGHCEPDNGNGDQVEAEAVQEVVATGLGLLISMLPWTALLDHLRRPRPLIPTTSHERMIRSLGVVGATICDLVAAVSPLSSLPAANRVLFKLDAVGTCIELFFCMPWHAALHHATVRIVEGLLQPMAVGLPLEKARKEAIEYLLRINLPHRLATATLWTENGRVGHSGHVLVLVRLLADDALMAPLLENHETWQANSPRLRAAMAMEEGQLCEDSVPSLSEKKDVQEAKAMKQVRKAIAASEHTGTSALLDTLQEKLKQTSTELSCARKDNETFIIRLVAASEEMEAMRTSHESTVEELKKEARMVEEERCKLQAELDTKAKSMEELLAEAVALKTKMSEMQRQTEVDAERKALGGAVLFAAGGAALAAALAMFVTRRSS